MANGYDDGYTEDSQYGGGDRPTGNQRQAPPRRASRIASPPAQRSGGPSASPRGYQEGNSFQSASDEIQDAFRTYLGRDASQQDILDHLSNGQHFAPHNVQHAIRMIRTSEEARLYKRKQDTKSEMQDWHLEHLDRELSDEEFDKFWDEKGFEGLDEWLRDIEEQGKRLKAGTPSGGMPRRKGRAPSGYNQTKWADDGPDGEHSVKYDAAAFLYGVTTAAEIQRIVESSAFQERFPGATFDGTDSIDFKGALSDGNPVGVVDVLLRPSSHQEGSGGLWWDALGPGGAGGGDAPPGPGTPGSGSGDSGSGDSGQNREWTQPPGSPLFNPPLTQGPPSMGSGGGGGTMGQMITPYNPLETYSPVPYTPPPPFRPPFYQGATPFGQEPYVAADPYTSPTLEEYGADPGYQFRKQQGEAALERSGAALGVTNTGGTLKDIIDYGQRAASQEIGNVDRRMRDTYEMNERNRFNAYQSNYGNAMNAYNMNERNLGGAFDRNLGAARDAYAMNEENRYRGYTTNELARLSQNQEAEARRSGAYGTNLGAYERQQQYGLRAQGQGFDQSFRNWEQQWNQGRQNAQDIYNRMYGLR